MSVEFSTKLPQPLPQAMLFVVESVHLVAHFLTSFMPPLPLPTESVDLNDALLPRLPKLGCVKAI
jgi:hypothetical protein